jgi:hypothetical protein
MLVTIGTWVFATGLVVLSLESFEVAIVLFGVAFFLFAHGQDTPEGRRSRLPKTSLLWGPEIGKFSYWRLQKSRRFTSLRLG